ncbi:nucleotide-binding protein [Candidatus Woesearchaeota archaeon]|nr:nucleotide-binding protein [Candidatus Woesearchaeota archaeon]
MITVLLDTNFLLIPGQFRVDIFSEIERVCGFAYELAVLDLTIGELKGIALHQKGRDKEAALLALRLLDAKKVRVIDTKNISFKNVDQIILNYAGRGAIAATQDRALQSALRRKGVRLLVLRQKKYLMLSEN